MNFFIDSAAADFANASTATAKFTWDNGKNVKEVNLKELTPDANGLYKATVDVVAAQMAHKIHAEVYLDGTALSETNDFSVQDYAETVYANPGNYDSEKSVQLKKLVGEMLHYGAMAQTVFASALNEKPNPADTNISAADFSGVDASAIDAAITAANGNETADDMNEVAGALDANYYTTSLIFLSRNTLRHYFTANGELFRPAVYDGNLSDYYYYVEKKNIPADELDNLQTFNVGGAEFV